MEVTTPTPPKVREPRPAKLDRQGNALVERRVAAVSAAKPSRPAHSRPTGKVTIGRDGQVHSRPSGKVTIGRDGQLHSRPSGHGTGRPVHRVNRSKRRG